MALGANTAAEPGIYDVTTIGAGMAVVYGASEGLRTVVVEHEATGGRPARGRVGSRTASQRGCRQWPPSAAVPPPPLPRVSSS